MNHEAKKAAYSADDMFDVYEDTLAGIKALEALRVFLSDAVNARLDAFEERLTALERTTPRMCMSPKELAAYLGQSPSTIYVRIREMQDFVGPGKRYPMTAMLSDGSTRKVDRAAYYDFVHYRKWLKDPKRAAAVPAYGADLPNVEPTGKRRKRVS